VWTMESASRWTVVQGSATKATSSVHSQGSYSLSVTASNVVALKGAAVSKPTEPMSQILGIDVMIPAQAGSASWGTVQLLLDAPAEQVYGSYLGQVALAPPKSTWQTIAFNIPQDVYYKLSARSFTDLAVTLTLNPMGGNGGAFLFDNLRFLPAAGCASLTNGTLCDDAVACTTGNTCTNGVCGSGTLSCDLNAGVRGFETPLAWSVSSGTGSLIASTTVHQGAKSLSVVAPVFTKITSIQIATEPTVGKRMGLWVQIPTSQPNAGWHGEITLTVTIPGLSINYSQPVPLLLLATGSWVELPFTLPDDVYTKMATNQYASLYYSITINPPNGQTGAYLFDDLHFEPVSSCTGALNRTACEDNNRCTEGGQCFNGACGTTVNCNDGNACTDDSCSPSTGCIHINNTATCDDSNACTTNDTCSGGACVGGPALSCDDGNLCTDDACNAATGCVHTNNSAACDDSNACTTSDTCSGGACVGGPAPSCDDGNVCTDDACDTSTGCVHTNNTAACDDSNACTTSDTCSGGACVGGPAPNCDDENVCTDNACDPASGCVFAANTAPCDDGNLCTAGDTCSNGVCTSGLPHTCTAQDVCHLVGTCNPGTGICSNPLRPGCTECTGQQVDCDGNPNNGCETDTSSDVNNCGACGVVCRGADNATPACMSNKCALCFGNNCAIPPALYTVKVKVVSPGSQQSVSGLPVYALNTNGKVFFTGRTGPDGIATMTVDGNAYQYGADVMWNIIIIGAVGGSIRNDALCVAPGCSEVTLEIPSFSPSAVVPPLLPEADSKGEVRDLGKFTLPNQGERTVDLGSIPAGATIRLGTYHADGDLIGAYSLGDVSLRLWELKTKIIPPIPYTVTLADNEDAGMDPGLATMEDIRGASYLSFTTARTAHLFATVTCKSAICLGDLKLKGDVDSNGGVQNVVGALGMIDAHNDFGQRHLIRFDRENCDDWFQWYDKHCCSENKDHFQGVQRLRVTSGLAVNTQHLALSGSGDGDLFMIKYYTKSETPQCLGPQAFNGKGGTPIARSQFNYVSDHPGGIQTFGHYLGGGFDANSGGGGTVMHWDVNGPRADTSVPECSQPGSAFVPVFRWESGKQTSAVGIAKLTGQNAPMVMVAGGTNTSFVRVLRKRPNRWGYTNPERSDEQTKWTPDRTQWPSPTNTNYAPENWPDGSLDVSTEWPYSKECCSIPGPLDSCILYVDGSYCGTTRAVFQSLQLLVESDGDSHATRSLYLAGAYASEQDLDLESVLTNGVDEMTLFKLNLTAEKLRAPMSEQLGLVGKTRVNINGDRRMVFHCAIDGDRKCNFSASFGIYVDPDRESLSAYSSWAFRPEGNGPVSVVEFAGPNLGELLGDDEVQLCTEPNFQGTCATVPVSQAFLATTEHVGITNDETHSIRVGNKATLVAFVDGSFSYNTANGSDPGRNWRVFESGDYPTLGDFPGKMSSAILRPKNQDLQNPGPGQVTVCSEPDGTGICAVLRPGLYPDSEGWSSPVDGTGGAFGVHNDWMKSVIVPPGSRVRVFADTELGGDAVVLENSTTTYKTINLSNLGFKVSSVAVL
jgi:hypothetical protein